MTQNDEAELLINNNDEAELLINNNDEAELLINNNDEAELSINNNPESNDSRTGHCSSCFSKPLHILRSLSIEVVMFCYMFGYYLNLSCLSNMMMDKGCLFYYNYSIDLCLNLSKYPNEKSKVEILASNYCLYSNLTILLAAISMTFIAPWSDKYGRKPPLIAASLCTIASDIGYNLCTIYFDSKLEYIVLCTLVSQIAGGFICILTIVFSHASEVSTEEKRTMKHTSIQIAFRLGMSLGGLAGGLLYRYCGYIYIYGIGLAMHTLCIPWVIFCVPETTGLGLDIGWLQKIKDLFVCDSITLGWKAATKYRKDNERTLLVLLILTMSGTVATIVAFQTIDYIYAHHVYNWDPTIYNIAFASFCLMQMAVTLFIAPCLISRYSMKDSMLGVIGALSMMGRNFFTAFSKYHVSIYYLGYAVGCLGILCASVVRSRVSKLLDPDEMGTIFAFSGICEAIITVIGSVILLKVFSATLDIFPSICYLIAVLFLTLPLGTFIWSYKRSRKTSCLTLNGSCIENKLVKS